MSKPISLGMSNPHTVQLMALAEQIQMAKQCIRAAEGILQTLQLRIPSPLPSEETSAPPAPPAAPPAPPAPPPAPPAASSSDGNLPVIKRTKLTLFADAQALGIPMAVMNLPKYLNGKFKPSKEGVQAALKLISDVQFRRDQGDDPAPLWAADLSVL